MNKRALFILPLILLTGQVMAMDTTCVLEETFKKTALISVSNKTGIIPLAQSLFAQGYEQILSTDGTCKYLKEGLEPQLATRVKEISEHTEFPECFDGRVKTLHPSIHGGILQKRNSESHRQEAQWLGIAPIDCVVANLYPFQQTIQKPNATEEDAIENIDIGGVTLIRAAAKNFKDVTVLTSPSDYALIQSGKTLTQEDRKALALKAFAHTAQYDGAITQWMSSDNMVPRLYTKQKNLKYGLNPHQKNAAIYTINGENQLPFTVLNGDPGYINMLDAVQSWQLVKEAKETLGLPCSASFKHVSPAGVGLAVEIPTDLKKVYGVENEQLTPVATSFVRARNSDPKSSFGDVIAISDEVDECTANLIGKEVSDGIIAPSYSKEALARLKQKKDGKYLILQMNADYKNPQQMEFKEINGIALSQEPNRAVTDSSFLKVENISTQSIDATLKKEQRDLILANIALKYTQSNSVAYAKDGQVIGIGAGQQNRVDCVKLAGQKVALWYLRQHPKVLELFSKFKKGTKRTDKNNAITACIEGNELDQSLFEKEVYTYSTGLNKNKSTQHDTVKIEPLTQKEKESFLSSLKDVAMASDAFFPFRDSIDEAAKYGVSSILQPGGGEREKEIVKACNEHGISMACSGVRMFTH
jgi:phosphoribosylaminoimidazolecarboxamide formyltransferase/IMP cyclohydrolase